MDTQAKIYVAGHRGLVGSAVVRALEAKGYTRIVCCTHEELDLCDQAAVGRFFREERPEYVFLAAAKVGGILANNTLRADFISNNLAIQSNVIDASYRYGVKKLLFLGSSCIYPRACPQPIKEEYLLTGPLEPTNEPYAIAKIAGLKMCESYNRQYGTRFLSAMPTNLYGPNDNFELQHSHVLPALIRKFVEATESGESGVTVWGSGRPRREFLHVDDAADAFVYLMSLPDEALFAAGVSFVNIGTGEDISIADLAGVVREATGFAGEIRFDVTKPDGMMQKRLDVSQLNRLNWRHQISLAKGVRSTVEWFKAHRNARGCVALG